MRPAKRRDWLVAFRKIERPDLWRSTVVRSQHSAESNEGWESLPDPGDAKLGHWKIEGQCKGQLLDGNRGEAGKVAVMLGHPARVETQGCPQIENAR